MHNIVGFYVVTQLASVIDILCGK